MKKQNLFLLLSLLSILKYSYTMERNSCIELFNAVCLGLGQEAMTKWLLRNKAADINMQDNEGKTVLHYAVSVHEDNWFLLQGKMVKMVKWLVQNGADLTVKDYDGNTPLHCVSGSIVAGYLIEHGADINAKNNQGQTPMEVCKDIRTQYFLRMVQESLTNPTQETIKKAIELNFPAVVMLVLQSGLVVPPIEHFHLAKKHNNKEIRQLLIRYFNFYKERSAICHQGIIFQGLSDSIKKHIVALSFACDENLYNVLKQKIQANPTHDTLYKAIEKNFVKLVLVHLESGICPQEKHIQLALKENKQAIATILQKYIDLEEQINSNPTQELLDQAVDNGFLVLVKLSIHKGINPTEKHLAIAKENSYKKVGYFLNCYLGSSNSRSGVSKSGISTAAGSTIPQEIDRHIISYT
jgi:Ankyrin repeats (3 copies)